MCLLIVGLFCRAIYLRKSIAAKLIFLLFQLCAWHLWLLFILPASSVTDRSVTEYCLLCVRVCCMVGSTVSFCPDN